MLHKNRIIATLTAILCVFSLQISYAQQPGEKSYLDESVMSGGKKGERIQSIIDTLNSNDPGKIRRFMEEECTEKFRKFASMDEHINVFLSIRRQWGGVDFHSIRTYVPERKGETVVILKDRNFESWRAFVIKFDKSENLLIAGLQFNDARTPSNVNEPNISEKQFVQMAKDMIRQICKRDVFSGTVLVAKGDEVLLTQACG